MTTMELFALAVGMAGVAERIDEFAESFDVDFSDSDIRNAVEEARQAKDIGQSVWLMFMDELESKFQNDFPNFDSDKFDWFCNGWDSHFYYGGQEISSTEDLEEILGE